MGRAKISSHILDDWQRFCISFIDSKEFKTSRFPDFRSQQKECWNTVIKKVVFFRWPSVCLLFFPGWKISLSLYFYFVSVKPQNNKNFKKEGIFLKIQILKQSWKSRVFVVERNQANVHGEVANNFCKFSSISCPINPGSHILTWNQQLINSFT